MLWNLKKRKAEVQPGGKPVVLVHVRFSLITSHAGGSWKGQRLSKDISEHAARILNRERLEARCDIFLNYSVPLLAAAHAASSEMDIIVVVHSSSLLPDYARSGLEAAASKHPFIRIKYFSPDEQYEIRGELEMFLAEYCRGRTGQVIVPALRLDDDDLLSPCYFPILKKYAIDSFVGFTVHTPRGYEALYCDGGFTAFADMDAPKTGIGLAHIAKWCPVKEKFLNSFILPPGPHKDTDRKAPVILDGSKNCILRTKHFFNDARAVRDGYSFSSSEELEMRFFKTKVDPSDSVMLSSFPVLRRKK